MANVRISLVMSYTSKVGITCTEVISSYEELGYDDDYYYYYYYDSNNYSIQLLFSSVLSPTAKCPFRETTERTNTSYRVQLTGHMEKQSKQIEEQYKTNILAVKHINLLIISTNTGLHVSTPSSHHQALH
jgi:hypothetical protein